MEYKTALNVIFKERVPSSLKHCPSFSDKPLEEVLILHFLTKEGILVIL